jgi:tRNA A-37 threonylcarbamoyl transferase component Bud32
MPRFEMPQKRSEIPSEEREKIEREVQFILDQHPEEIVGRWEKNLESLTPDRQLAYVQRMSEMRREALAPKPYESSNLVALDSVPTEVEELFGKRFNEAVENMDEVNRGYNGRIMAFADKAEYKDIVYKVLTRHPIGRQNDLLSEASYLADMHVAISDKEDSARVPKVHYIATRQNAKIMAMERIPGHSIDEITRNNMPIPADFDIEAAEKACITLVEILHAAGISHNDLRVGNIMLDLSARGSASAYVIDAGNASRLGQGERSKDAAMLANTFAVLRSKLNRSLAA